MLAFISSTLSPWFAMGFILSSPLGGGLAFLLWMVPDERKCWGNRIALAVFTVSCVACFAGLCIL